MCIVSLVSEHYGKWPDPSQYWPNQTPIIPAVPMPVERLPVMLTPTFIDWTKAAPASLPWTKDTLKMLKRILKDLKALDTALGLSNCEDPKKAEWMKTIEAWVERFEAEKKKK